MNHTKARLLALADQYQRKAEGLRLAAEAMESDDYRRAKTRLPSTVRAAARIRRAVAQEPTPTHTRGRYKPRKPGRKPRAAAHHASSNGTPGRTYAPYVGELLKAIADAGSNATTETIRQAVGSDMLIKTKHLARYGFVVVGKAKQAGKKKFRPYSLTSSGRKYLSELAG